MFDAGSGHLIYSLPQLEKEGIGPISKASGQHPLF